MFWIKIAETEVTRALQLVSERVISDQPISISIQSLRISLCVWLDFYLADSCIHVRFSTKGSISSNIGICFDNEVCRCYLSAMRSADDDDFFYQHIYFWLSVFGKYFKFNFKSNDDEDNSIIVRWVKIMMKIKQVDFLPVLTNKQSSFLHQKNLVSYINKSSFLHQKI